jgi:23S rRNA (pseudouridine1915-N3)-methyltransferase
LHIRLLAVGDRQPSWVDEAFGIYTERFPREWKFRLDVIPTVRRNKNDKSRQAMEAEGELILAKLNSAEQVALLDERGKQFSSKGLAARMSDWQSDEQLYRAHSLQTGHPYHRA